MLGLPFVATVLLAVVMLGACASRAQPYRFASPMVAGADVPAAPFARTHTRDPLPPEERAAAPASIAHRTAAPIAIAHASPPPSAIASGEAAAAITDEPAATGAVISRLPSPHRLAADAPLPIVHTAADLRALVGRRDRRAPAVAALAWTAQLGHALDATDATTGAAVVAWADDAGRLADPAAVTRAAPGDLLVFDHTEGTTASDLLAIVIARDARGVTEFLYVGGGIVRRGFVDPSRRALRRDATGAVVNTYLRSGRRWPPAGTHYLAGELLAHVVKL